MLKNKDILAKLLATENITVRRSVKAETASFDLLSRVLTLPILKITSGDIADMMAGHEVGHALWTKLSEWEKAIEKEKIHKQILNIVEDARIEKKIKRKYPGIVKSFITGYKELAADGFFGRDAPDMRMPLVDRINLHAKMGWTGNIPFSEDEQWAVDAVASVESFADVKRVSKMLQMDYVESQQAMDHDFGEDFGSSRMDGGEEFDIEDWEDNANETTTAPAEIRKSSEPDPEDFDGDAGDLRADEFDTEATFENKKKDLSDTKANEYVYFKLPKPNLKNIIVPYKECDNLYGYMSDAHVYNYAAEGFLRKNYITDTADEFNNFRRSSQKIINYMVKEFERRKAANEHRRISIAKTGILDVNKLHSYRYNEDIFLKNAIMPDGKNHGMVMLLDWSASMATNMANTVKQLLNLVWFCQKVNIPFEVYAFTNAYTPHLRAELTKDIDESWTEKRIRALYGQFFSQEPGELVIRGEFSLLNFFSSRMSSRDITRMGKALYATASVLKGYRTDSCLNEFTLSSTPLVEALITMQTVIPNFIKAHKLHRTNFIVLTDGDANTGGDRVYMGDDAHHNAGRFDGYGVQGIYESVITRKQYRLDKICKYYTNKYDRQVNLLIRLLRDDHNINTIGIFLDNESRGKTVKRRHIEKYLGWFNFNREAHAKVRLGVKKNGFASIKDLAGYNEYYIVPTGSTVIEDGRIGDVDEDITKNKLKTLFVKAQKVKFGSRILADKMMNWLV